MEPETPRPGAPGDSEERVRIEAAQKDPSRFAELYEENFERMYAFIARRVHDRSDVQDLTAEVFHQALANLNRFEWRGAPFVAWLYRIARNAVADYYRRTSRQLDEPSDAETSADEMEKVEQRASLFRLVAQLPTDQQRVIVMRFAEGRSIREIAGQLGRSEGAVKQLQWRGVQTLRSRMGQNHG